MRMNYDLKGLRKPQNYRMVKKTGLVCLLLMVLMASAACSKSTKGSIGENNNTEDAINQPSDSLTAEPTGTEELDPAAEPTTDKAPEPTAQLVQMGEFDPTAELLYIGKSEPTVKLASKKPASTTEPTPISDFIPSEEVVHSTTAFTQGNYLFYKSGKQNKTAIVSKNLKTSKVTELTTVEDYNFHNSDFYLKGSDIYYLVNGDIYRIGVDGKNKTRLFKGTATILGFQNDDIFALDKKAREIIRIGRTGEKTSLVKLKSIDPLEAVMVPDGIYYISKSVNNTLDGNDPIDRLYFINFDGKNKTKMHESLDIFDLKSNEKNELFFLAISKEPEVMKLNKINNHKVTTIHSLSRKELEAQGCSWFESNTFTLLAANATQVYYGVDFNNGKTMNIYSVGTDGKNHGLYLNAFDIKGINPSAYFMKGDIDGGYLKVVFDCDEDPAETYLIDLKDKSTIKFEGGYYIPSSIDVEGEYVYYCKFSKYDCEGNLLGSYEYGRSEISKLEHLLGGEITVKSVDDSIEYQNGIYHYEIIDEAKKEVRLVKIDVPENKDTIEIPGEVYIHDSEYKIAEYNLIDQEKSGSVRKMIVLDSFTGELVHSSYDFPNVDTIEFLGRKLPKRVYLGVRNGIGPLDILILVPKGLESAYKSIISSSLGYENGGDLTEKSVTLNPTIVSKVTEDIEYGIFDKNKIIYQVTKSGKDKTGEVTLIGLQGEGVHKDTYLSLPETVTNNGYTYKLTAIDSSGLINSKAKIIVIPDTVTKMDGGIFSPGAQLIFFSKNCKELPGWLFYYGTYSYVEFMYVPEGVTTISRDAFNFGMKSGSIILPSTIKKLERGSLSDFKLVTFLNKKPISNIKSALGEETTVKVNKSAASAYKKVIGSKATVVNAKDIVKATKITLNKSKLSLVKDETTAITAKLTKGSNENVYWMSSDEDIVKVSSKGAVTAKKEGTAYIVAYTRTSGLHKAIKVTVTK